MAAKKPVDKGIHWLVPKGSKKQPIASLGPIAEAIREFAEHKREMQKGQLVMAAHNAKKTTTKVVEDVKPRYKSVGDNVYAKRVDNILYLKIDLDEEGTDSQSGRAVILARTVGQRGFTDMSEIVGDELGMNLILSKRKAPARKKARRDDD